MECIKILKKLNENKLKGYDWLIIRDLSERDRKDILECGYFIKNTKDGYKITST